MLNRRSFVQTLGIGAVGIAALDLATPASAQSAGAGGNRPAPGAGEPAPIRIGSNENPYGPAASALAAIADAAPTGNRYPGQQTAQLVSTIATKHGVPEDHVLLSCGSGDILKATVYACTNKTRALVTGLPSYEAPTRSAQHVGAPLREVALTKDLRLNLGVMATRAVGAGLIYICNPNNPSSTVVAARDIAALVDKVSKTSPGTYILVDEAYFEYGDMAGFNSAIPLVTKYPKLLVARTMSKIHAMAGMRVGYAIAQPKTLTEIKEYHSASGLSVMSLLAAVASLTDTSNIEHKRALNREVRAFTVDAFERAGYQVAASDANFVFVNVKRDSKSFQEACRLKGVQIGRAFPPMNTWARISIGTKAEMEAAVPVFMEILGAPPVSQTASLDHLDLLPNELT